ncbi:MFS transporter, partial [Kitasatospora sp. NPDC001574]
MREQPGEADRALLRGGESRTLRIGAAVVLGVHGGAVADRYDRRRILIAADGTRLLASASVPPAMALDRPALVHTLSVAVVIGATVAYSGPVRLLAVRSVVPPQQLRQAPAQDKARMSGAGLVGPPLAGALFGPGRGAPFVGTALASLLALASALLVRFPNRPGAADASPPAQDSPEKDGGALAGFRFLAATAFLRPTLAVVLVLDVAATPMLLPVMVIPRGQGTSSGGMGPAPAGEAVGALAGAFLVGRLHRLAGPGVLLLAVAGQHGGDEVPVPQQCGTLLVLAGLDQPERVGQP